MIRNDIFVFLYFKDLRILDYKPFIRIVQKSDVIMSLA